jgi:hypothetical protein
MNSTKSILLSKTFWGALLALIASVDPSLYSKILMWIGINDPTLLASKIIGLFGAMFAIYGRMAATQLVTLTGKPKNTMIIIPRAK